MICKVYFGIATITGTIVWYQVTDKLLDGSVIDRKQFTLNDKLMINCLSIPIGLVCGLFWPVTGYLCVRELL